PTPATSTLSLHDALPISGEGVSALAVRAAEAQLGIPYDDPPQLDADEPMRVELSNFQCVSLVESSLSLARCVARGDASAECFVRDRKSTRLNSSHLGISY